MRARICVSNCCSNVTKYHKSVTGIISLWASGPTNPFRDGAQRRTCSSPFTTWGRRATGLCKQAGKKGMGMETKVPEFYRPIAATGSGANGGAEPSLPPLRSPAGFNGISRLCSAQDAGGLSRRFLFVGQMNPRPWDRGWRPIAAERRQVSFSDDPEQGV